MGPVLESSPILVGVHSKSERFRYARDVDEGVLFDGGDDTFVLVVVVATIRGIVVKLISCYVIPVTVDLKLNSKRFEKVRNC